MFCRFFPPFSYPGSAHPVAIGEDGFRVKLEPRENKTRRIYKHAIFINLNKSRLYTTAQQNAIGHLHSVCNVTRLNKHIFIERFRVERKIIIACGMIIHWYS